MPLTSHYFWWFLIFSHFYYSLLNASTGSFLDAALAGIKPPIKVKIIAKPTNTRAWVISSDAESGMLPM